jgi:release factor glutamine methyltransferase
LRAVDIGTGSGAIALSLATEGPFAAVVATDPSGEALAVARLNLEHGDVRVPVEFRQGAGYDPLTTGSAGSREVIGDPERFDVIVSNPPYIAERDVETLEPEVRDWEPEGALLAGPEGLDVLAVLVAGAAAHLAPDGLLALEVGDGQAARVAELIGETGRFAPARIVRDLAGKDRIVLAELRSS